MDTLAESKCKCLTSAAFFTKGRNSTTRHPLPRLQFSVFFLHFELLPTSKGHTCPRDNRNLGLSVCCTILKHTSLHLICKYYKYPCVAAVSLPSRHPRQTIQNLTVEELEARVLYIGSLEVVSTPRLLCSAFTLSRFHLLLHPFSSTSAASCFFVVNFIASSMDDRLVVKGGLRSHS